MNELNERILEACKNVPTMGAAAKALGIPYMTFKRKAISLGVWNPNQGGKGVSDFNLNEVFSNSKKIRTRYLKERLFIEKYKEPKCECCGLCEEWNGSPLVLELDHINGNSNDNSLDNLRILCPNCHSQTPTFRGRKNKKCPDGGIW